VILQHILDTHPLLWFLAGSTRLGARAAPILADTNARLLLPATAFAEACWIVEHREVGLTVAQVLAAIDADTRITIVPLTRDVIERSIGLAAIREMHDRQIVATTLLLMERGENVVLVTRDVAITASGLVPVIW